APGLDGVTRYARATPFSATSSERGSSKLPTTTVADVFGSRAASLDDRTIARIPTPRISSCCSTADPVFPVAPVTRIKSSRVIVRSPLSAPVLCQKTVPTSRLMHENRTSLHMANAQRSPVLHDPPWSQSRKPVISSAPLPHRYLQGAC